jgi:uncharacterized protein (TIGR02246 family)
MSVLEPSAHTDNSRRTKLSEIYRLLVERPIKGGHKMVDLDAEREIRAVIVDVNEALASADAERLDSLLSDRPGCVHIGSDTKEWFSKAQLLAGIQQAMSVGSDQIKAEVGDLTVHVFGDVAWAEGTGRFVNSQGGARQVRMTGVFVRDDGRWKSAQSHASLGVPNEEMFSS